MPTIYRKSANTWQSIKSIYRKSNGTWQSIKQVWRKTNNVWQLVFNGTVKPNPEQQPELIKTINNLNLVVLEATFYHWKNDPTTVEYKFQYSTDNEITWNDFPNQGWQIIDNPSVGSSTTLTQTVAQTYVLANTLNKYKFRTRATNVNGNSIADSEIESIQGPTNITDLLATPTVGAENSSVTLTWSASTGASNYIVYFGTFTAPTTISTVTSSTTATVGGLNPNLTYYFRVRPITGSATYPGYYGNYSNEVVPSAKPSGGGNASITGQIVQGQTVTLNAGDWYYTPTTYYYDLEYLLSMNVGGNTILEWTNLTTITSTSKTVSYTIPSNYISLYGNQIRLTVRASNSSGSSVINNLAGPYTVLSAPQPIVAQVQNLSATAPTPLSGNLYYSSTISWDRVLAASPNYLAAASYRIEYKVANIGEFFASWNFLATVADPGTGTRASYTSQIFQNGKAYQFRVIAYSGTNGTGTEGAASNTYQFSITNVAGDFTINTTSKQYPTTSGSATVRNVQAYWSDSQFASSYRYTIEKSSDNINWSTASLWTGTSSLPASDISVTGTSFTASIVYEKYYRIILKAYSGYLDPKTASNSPQPATGSAPSSPTVLASQSSVTTNSISIGYNTYTSIGSQGSNNFSGIKYAIYKINAIQNNPLVWSALQTSNPFTISNLQPGTIYDIYLNAVNNDDLESTSTLYQAVTTNVAPGSVRNLNRDLAAYNNVSNQKRVYWDAPNTGGTITNYEYRTRRNASGVNWSSWINNYTNLSVILTLDSDPAGYLFEVRAVGPGGAGTSSSFGEAIIMPVVGVPTATSITNNSAIITWTSQNQVSYAITTTPTTSTVSGSSSTSQAITGLSSSTQYTAKVLITSGSGDTVFNTSSTFTTLAPLGAFTYSISDSTITPSAPSAFSLIFSLVNNAVQVSYDWNDTSNTTSWFSSISGGLEGNRSNVRGVSNDYWSVTSGYAYTASVYSINDNKKVTVSWTSSSGASSYIVSYTRSGATSNNGFFTSPVITTNSTDILSYDGTITINSVTAYSNNNGTGTTANGTVSGSSSVTSTQKVSSTTNASENAPYVIRYYPNTTDSVLNMPSPQFKYPGVLTTISGLIPSRTGYTFRFWTQVGSGVARFSGEPYNSDSDADLNATWGAPATPTNVSVSASGLVTWAASSGATSYTIEYYCANGSGQSGTPSRVGGPYTGTSSTTSFQINYPTVNGVLLNYARARVSATNTGGTSSYSAWYPSSTTYV